MSDEEFPDRRAEAVPPSVMESSDVGVEQRVRDDVHALEKGLLAIRSTLALLCESRVWRTIQPVLRAWMNPRSLGRGDTILDTLKDQAEDIEGHFQGLRDALIPAEGKVSYSDGALRGGFGVSVLVTNRNGVSVLSRFLETYAAHHDAEEAELIVVDHGSTDGSIELIQAWMDRLPVVLLLCDRNQRYSVANNLARRHASGDVLVFANNDLAFEGPVLDGLVECLATTDIGLAGAELRYPAADGGRSGRIQHRGITFAWDPAVGFMRPRNSDKPVTEQLPAAVTAALVACRASDFDAVGGFHEGFDYGFEDVDLALKLRFSQQRFSALAPGVSALHEEFGTQDQEPSSKLDARRLKNAILLRQRHGQRLVREVISSQVSGGVWHREPLMVRLPEALRSKVGELGPDASFAVMGAEAVGSGEGFCGLWFTDSPQDFALRPPPSSAVAVGCLAPDSLEAWRAIDGFHSLPLLACVSEELMAVRARVHAEVIDELIAPNEAGTAWLRRWADHLVRHVDRIGIAIKIAMPEEKQRNSWGDFHFAEALGRALRDLGYRVQIDALPAWYAHRLVPDDINLVLRGLERYQPQPGAINLAWLISHPDKATDAELNGFDHVFVASKPHARRLEQRLEAPVSPLLQCTDPHRFPLAEDPEHPNRILFVGNSKGFLRPVVGTMLEQQVPVEVWGTWWEEHIDRRFIQGQQVLNDELGALYGNSGIVLNDHWEEMRRLGFLSNRLFDAVATGALVISDEVEGMDALFGEAVLALDDVILEETALLQRAAASRVARAEKAREIARDHTFVKRADALHAVIESLRAGAGAKRSAR
ncbi:MAG: glycosyltransferase [Pseudomonadota bacterium]